MSEIDTGFGAVLAGEVYQHPDDVITATVKEEPCLPSSTTAASPTPIPASLASTPLSSETTSSASSSPSKPAIETPATASPASNTTNSSTDAVTTLTPLGVQAAKALVHLPAHLNWPVLAQLAREIAMNIKERHVVLSEFKLSNVQYDFLEAYNEFYRSALAAACKEWQAPLSTAERIKVEAAAILEDSLLGLGARMQNKGEGLPGVIEAAKLFAKVAGVGEPKVGNAAPGERFVINIDLGGDQKVTASVLPAPTLDLTSLSQGKISSDG